MTDEPADRPQDAVGRGYDRVADAYAALERPGATWPRLRRLQQLLARLPAGADVLDAGCGNGVPTMRAICERHSGVGVDISGEQIRRARSNVPGGTFIRSDVTCLDFPESAFDAIVAFYAVEHVPRDQHAALFRRFRLWLRPGGYLLFTLEPYDEPGRTGEWLGVPMFISSFDPDTTIRLLAEAGFEVLSRDVESQLEGEREIEYLWVLARRPG